ncbi:hypothetical protein [Halomicrococcus sp. SG-WS-1]|uniref:hypothetical protein n=1 Tax=Halomicrococcus sp. SG-WS-1 TaxID=3439057 RepID=UPI003F7A76C6
MASDGDSSLTPLAQDAVDALATAVPANESFGYDRAYSILAEAEGLDQPAADDILERLLSRGYLYEVDGYLRLTDS